MRYVAPARKQLGVPTAFNYLGPLSNPVRAEAQALGCASEKMAPLLAGVLADRGVRGLVFRGSDGRDKITTSGPTTIFEVRGDRKSTRLNSSHVAISYAVFCLKKKEE